MLSPINIKGHASIAPGACQSNSSQVFFVSVLRKARHGSVMQALPWPCKAYFSAQSHGGSTPVCPRRARGWPPTTEARTHSQHVSVKSQSSQVVLDFHPHLCFPRLATVNPAYRHWLKIGYSLSAGPPRSHSALNLFSRWRNRAPMARGHRDTRQRAGPQPVGLTRLGHTGH